MRRIFAVVALVALAGAVCQAQAQQQAPTPPAPTATEKPVGSEDPPAPPIRRVAPRPRPIRQDTPLPPPPPVYKHELGDPVIDRTSLTGLWSFSFVYARNLAAEANVPSLTTALGEELGLKLESGRGLVDVLVIDSVQQPTEN